LNRVASLLANPGFAMKNSLTTIIPLILLYLSVYDADRLE
jgi:hypothetical protein